MLTKPSATEDLRLIAEINLLITVISQRGLYIGFPFIYTTCTQGE